MNDSPEYPLAGKEVDGLIVSSDVPNMGSISASLSNYTILKGIREVPMLAFDGPHSVFYAKDDFDRSTRLALKITMSGWIAPLIIVVEKEGPYILEGAHRYVALYKMGKKNFPAVVVVDNSDR